MSFNGDYVPSKKNRRMLRDRLDQQRKRILAQGQVGMGLGGYGKRIGTWDMIIELDDLVRFI